MDQDAHHANPVDTPQSLVEPLRTPEPAAAESPQKDKTAASPDWKTSLERVGGILAIAAILIGNLAKILDGLKSMFDQLHGITLPAMPKGLLIFFIVVGYVILLWLLRRHAAAEGSFHRRAVMIGAIVCFAAFGGNAWFLVQERLTNRKVDEIQETWSQRLQHIQVQDASGRYGGFRYTLTPNTNAYPDAWSTAQCIRSIVMSNPQLPSIAGRLRVAFEFILSERVRSTQQVPRIGIGWVTTADEHLAARPQRITRTEISAWVALAYTAALQSHAVWSDRNETAIALGTLGELASDLVARQGDEGSWGASYKPVVPEAQRVYSSALAVWALVEARSLLQPKQQIDRSIYTGTEWLIDVYRSDRGWNPEATIDDDPNVYPALTAQVLFILKLATDTNAANALKSNPKYRSARQQFPDLLRRCHKVPGEILVQNETQHIQKQEDAKLYGSEDLNVHFVEYPWCLAILETLKSDPDLTWSQRRAAVSLEEEYLTQLDDLESNLSAGMTYILAEHLIGLTYLEAMRFGYTKVPFLVPTAGKTN